MDSPIGGATGSLVAGAAAVSVGVGLGAVAEVPLVVLVAAGVVSFLSLRLKRALSLSIASRAVGGKKTVGRRIYWETEGCGRVTAVTGEDLWKQKKLQSRRTNSRHVGSAGEGQVLNR